MFAFKRLNLTKKRISRKKGIATNNDVVSGYLGIHLARESLFAFEQI
jgi:hypothetical protein